MANRDPIRFIVLPPDWLTDTDELVRRTAPAVLGTDAEDYPNRHKNQRLPTGRILAENGERCSDASGLFPAAIVVPQVSAVVNRSAQERSIPSRDDPAIPVFPELTNQAKPTNQPLLEPSMPPANLPACSTKKIRRAE